MAKTTKEKTPQKGSQRETPVEGTSREGVSFRELIQSATGSEAPTAAEFESAMAARGYRASDVRKLTRAFKKVNDSGKDYLLRDEGFDVFGSQGQETGSGQARGNKAGLDLGDLVGLGSDVSLLAGALRNEKNSRDAQAAQAQQQQTQVSPEQRIDGSLPQSLSPETAFAVTMGDLLKASAQASAESKAGKRGPGPNGEEADSNKAAGRKTGEQGRQTQADNFKPGDIFQPNPDILNYSLLDDFPISGGNTASSVGKEQAGQTGPSAAQAQGDMRTKGERGRELLMGIDPGQTPGFFDFSAEDFGLEAYGLGEAATDIGTGGQMLAPWLAPLRKTRGLGKALAGPSAALGLTGVAMKGVGDAINPNEDINWRELGGDAANIAAMALLNKMVFKNTPGAQPSQLPGGSRLKPTRFSGSGSGKSLQETAQAFKGQIQGRARNAQNAFEVSPFKNAGLQGTARSTPQEQFLYNMTDDLNRLPVDSRGPLNAAEIEANFLNNLTDDISRLPIKRRGGVITKFRL